MDGLINYGIIKPELANAFAIGMEESQRSRNELTRQRQAEQLANIQLQNALREQRMAGEEEAAYKAAGNDMAKLQSELMQRGLGKQSLAVGAQMQKQQADKIKMLKEANDLKKSTATAIFANPTLDAAVAATQAFGQRTGLDVTADLQQLQQIGDNPEAIRQWAAGHAMEADKLLPKFQQFETPGGGRVVGTVDPLTGQFKAGQTMAPQLSPYESARLEQERRRLTLAEEEATQKRDPEFQQRMAQARAMGEAAGKGNAAALQAYPSAVAKAAEAVQLVDQMIGKRDAEGNLLKGQKPHPGFEWAVGAGINPMITPGGTPAADFQALYEQVKGGAFLQAFEALKGGGAITEKEGEKATAALTRMKLAQSEKEFIKAAMEFQDNVRAGVERARQKAIKAGGAAPAAAPAAPATGGVKFLGFE